MFKMGSINNLSRGPLLKAVPLINPSNIKNDKSLGNAEKMTHDRYVRSVDAVLCRPPLSLA